MKHIKKKVPSSIISILTNLSLYSEEIEKLLVESFGFYDVVQVSVYAHTKELHFKISGRDDWEKINFNIKKLLECNINIRTNLTVTPDNIMQTNEIIEFYTSLGITDICISPLLNKGRGREYYSWEYILDYIERISVISTKNHQNIHLALPTEIVYLYNQILFSLGLNTSRDLNIDSSSDLTKSLYIDYDGSLFDGTDGYYLGNVKGKRISALNYSSTKKISSNCQKCFILDLCGG